MAAGLGFKDFVTGEVLTAADVDGYLMQGVWVFASAAARDAAVTSPQEGNFAYLKDTNVTTYYTGSAWANLDTTGMTNPMTTTGDIIYSSPGSTPVRLGIGSTDQILTVAGGVPTWATPAGGGGMTLLSTTTLSGASTTVSSIDQTYQTLLVFIHNATWGSGNGTVYIKPNNVANQCSFIGTYWQGSAGNSGSSATDIQSYLNTTNSSGLGFAAVNFYRYANTSQWKLYSGTGANNDSGGSGVAYVYGGGVKTTSAITSLNFYPSSGANFSGGTVLIYGVK